MRGFCLVTTLLFITAEGTGQTDRRTAGGIHERKVRLIGASDKQLTIFVKLPPGARSGADVSGVFAFCTWESDPDDIRAVLRGNSGGIGNVIGFAAKHNLAVVSWTTFSGRQTFDKGRSFDEMTRREAAKFDQEFNKVARTWRRGVDDLIRDYKLPASKWLLSGMSRGAQWSHRIALREPDLFAAIHIHINSSYDEPVPEAANIRWLVTTGELEAGYPAAKRFYAAARALNYPMIFHGEPKIAHESNGNITRLGTVFFEYVVEELKSAAAGRAPKDRERFVGNYFTHEFVPWERGASVPEMYRVILPDRKIAEAWGLEAEDAL